MSDADDKARKYRKQDATYWVRTGTSSAGRPTYGAPSDIKVRWSDKNEVFTGPTGEEVVSAAVVIVGIDMKVTDRLRLGTVATIPGGSGADPARVPGSYEIRVFQKEPDRRATRFVRWAVL
jgi:hypothetical protein